MEINKIDKELQQALLAAQYREISEEALETDKDFEVTIADGLDDEDDW